MRVCLFLSMFRLHATASVSLSLLTSRRGSCLATGYWDCSSVSINNVRCIIQHSQHSQKPQCSTILKLRIVGPHALNFMDSHVNHCRLHNRVYTRASVNRARSQSDQWRTTPSDGLSSTVNASFIDSLTVPFLRRFHSRWLHVNYVFNWYQVMTGFCTWRLHTFIAVIVGSILNTLTSYRITSKSFYCRRRFLFLFTRLCRKLTVTMTSHVTLRSFHRLSWRL